MPTITYECLCGPFERQFSIMKAPPETLECSDCDRAAVRVWEAPEFICDRADRDPDNVPAQFQVSDGVRPESKEEGIKIEKAYQRKLDRRRRQLAEDGGGAIKHTNSVPSHLYHGKIRQTGDKNYWLDEKNRNKHSSTKIDGYGRARRGKG